MGNSHTVEGQVRMEHAQSLVAFLCPRVWGVRNVVHSGLLEDLHGRGMSTCLLVPENDWEPGWVGYEWVRREPLFRPTIEASQRGLALVNGLIHHSFEQRHGIYFNEMFSRWVHRGDPAWRRVRRRILSAASRVTARQPLYGALARYREARSRKVWGLATIERQLRSLSPTLLVSTNSQFWEEKPYVFAAADLGIPALGCIQSFDNLTTRGLLPVFDHYALWNERMRDQLLEFYPDRDPAKVHITGTPQFDFHVRPEFRWSRAETLQRLGLEPGDRYVMFAPSAFPSETELLIQLAQRFGREAELTHHRIVVRPHPKDDPRRWSGVLGSDARFVLSWPWQVAEGVPWDAPGLASPNDQARLVSSLAHADVCLNSSSTISLDSAAAGTPVVCIGFAGGGDPEENRVVWDGHFSTHYRPIIESGGVRLARDMNALIGEVIAYVRDRSRHAVLREALVRGECGMVDGECGRRVADVIESLCVSKQRDLGCVVTAVESG